MHHFVHFRTGIDALEALPERVHTLARGDIDELRRLAVTAEEQLISNEQRTADLAARCHSGGFCQRQMAARALRALVDDRLPPAIAAHDAGFADQSHMTRVFVRQYGFTPGAWRRAVGA